MGRKAAGGEGTTISSVPTTPVAARRWSDRLPGASAALVTRLSVVTLVSVAGIVLTGGAVRLTGSGLGCSDWPACTSTSIVAPLQYHAWVEFGNRLVNVLITVAIVFVALAAIRRRPRRRDLLSLSLGLVAGIFAEVV